MKRCLIFLVVIVLILLVVQVTAEGTFSDEYYGNTCYGTENCTVENSEGSSESVGDSSSGSSGGGGGTLNAWKKTYNQGDRDIKDKISITQTLNERERVKIKSEEINYYIGIEKIAEDSSTISLHPGGKKFVLSTDGEEKVDLNADGYYNLLMKVLDIEAKTVTVRLDSLLEKISPFFSPEDSRSGITGKAVQQEKEITAASDSDQRKGNFISLLQKAFQHKKQMAQFAFYIVIFILVYLLLTHIWKCRLCRNSKLQRRKYEYLK